MTTRKRTAQEAGLADDDRGGSGSGGSGMDAASNPQLPLSSSSSSSSCVWGGIEAILAETYERNFEQLQVLRR